MPPTEAIPTTAEETEAAVVSAEPPRPKPPRASHATLLTGAQVCRGVFRLIFLVVTARVLGPEVFGVYALLLATIEMIAVASGTGYTDYLTREAATDHQLGWGLAEQLAGVRCACTIPLAGAGIGVLWLLHYRHAVIAAAAWFSLTLLFRAASEAIQGVLRGTAHYWAFLYVELALGCGLMVGTGVLLVRGGGVAVVVATEIVAAMAAALVAISFAANLSPRSRTHLPLRELVKKSVIFNVYAFVGNLYDRVDVLILSKLAGDYATGIYSAAYRPLGAIQLLPYGILYSLLPSLSRGNGSSAEVHALKKAMDFLFSAAFFIVLVTVVFAPVVVRTCLGSAFSEAALAIEVLIWAVVFRYINYAFNILLLAVRQENVFIYTSAVCLIVNVAGNVLLVPLFRWKAAAVMTIATEIVLLAQNAYWIRRVVGVVPFPRSMATTTLFFAICLLGSILGKYNNYPYAIGALCICVFAYVPASSCRRLFADVRGNRSALAG